MKDTLESDYAKPTDQEAFLSTPWERGNTGITKRVNYNDSFEMFYRLVDTSKRLDNNSCLERKPPKTQYLQGGQNTSMGGPKIADDPDPQLVLGERKVSPNKEGWLSPLF